MKRNILVGLLCIVATSRLLGQGAGSSTLVEWSNDSNTLLRDMNGALLTSGSSVNNDGALIQLGYFSMGSDANNFNGTWIPITGATAVNPTTIGDSPDNSGFGDGTFIFNTKFNVNSSAPVVYPSESAQYSTTSAVTVTFTTPPANQTLAIRFYDNNSGTGKYNTVSSDDWNWSVPNDLGLPVVSISLAAGNLAWESVDVFGLTGTEFKTVLPIPEPSTYALIGLGAVGMMALRRRIKR